MQNAKLIQYNDVECVLPLFSTSLRKWYIYNGILPRFELVSIYTDKEKQK